MIKRSSLFILGSLALAIVGVGWVSLRDRGAAEPHPRASPEVASGGRREPLRSPIRPIPRSEGLNRGRVELGRELFHDALLSVDETVSCSTCHDIEFGGDDGRPFSVGVDGHVGVRNAPTVLNSRFNFRQFWDGRAASLEEQIDGPLLGSGEMGSSWEEVLRRLRSSPSYSRRFEEAYGGPPTEERVRNALATFERSLVTPDSPFDRYLLGEEGAISAEARAGYELFLEVGCATCHQGVNVGGNMFQPLGLMEDYFEDVGEAESSDGRAAVTGLPDDVHVFKVPALRNVALTAPYFHDGSANTLHDAIRTMARYQLGVALEDREVDRIEAFLESLTGEIPRSR